MNPRPLLCLVGVLALSGIPLWADSVFFSGPSPGVKLAPTDALGKYKQYVYDIVGSYWYPEVDHHAGTLPPGKVRIQFTVHSDGTVSDVTVLEGSDQKTLVSVCKHTLEAPSPYKPFSDSMIKQVGEKYTDDFTFTITNPR